MEPFRRLLFHGGGGRRARDICNSSKPQSRPHICTAPSGHGWLRREQQEAHKHSHPCTTAHTQVQSILSHTITTRPSPRCITLESKSRTLRTREIYFSKQPQSGRALKQKLLSHSSTDAKLMTLSHRKSHKCASLSMKNDHAIT